MKYNFTIILRINLFILSILIFLSACNKDKGENNIMGEWRLKNWETTCEQEEVNEEIELIESNGKCCILLNTATIIDSNILTNSRKICESLIFKDDGELLVVSEEMTSLDTSQFSYTIVNNSIDVCNLTGDCIQYEIKNDQIQLSIEVPTIAGNWCDRTISYKR